jgi:hypothetical protein
MRISIASLAPNTKFVDESPKPDAADSHLPEANQLIQRLRDTMGTPFSEELVRTGTLGLEDLRFHRINRRLASVACMLQRNHDSFVGKSAEICKEYSEQFLRRAEQLSWSGIIPLEPRTIKERFSRLDFCHIDSTKSGDITPRFDADDLTIWLPIPVLDGCLPYEDFVHEALHGISGRHVAHAKLHGARDLVTTTTETIRSGLRFTVPGLETYSDRFIWLNEGMTEHLSSLFLPESEQSCPAYQDEVDLVRTLIAPQGVYRIPLRAITAAYFADFHPAEAPSLRYPEWYDLNAVLPIAELLKISRLIERRGLYETLCIVSSRNIFGVSEHDL